jgi:ABC-type multidrug transport system permease subunit
VFFILNSFPNFSQLLVPRFISDRNIFEAREGPSKTYSWYTFLCSNMIVEACWISIVAVLTFVIWYYIVGFADSIPDAEKAERGVLMFLMIWKYFLFSSTFSYMMIAGVEHAQTG